MDSGSWWWTHPTLDTTSGTTVLWLKQAVWFKQLEPQDPGWKVGNRVMRMESQEMDHSWRCKYAGGPGIICGTVKTSLVVYAGIIKREETWKGNQGHICMYLHTSALCTKLRRNLNLTIVCYIISNNVLLNFSIFVCKI